MNRSLLARVVVILAAGAALIFGQAEPAAEGQATSTSPVAPQPQPKTQEELAALQAIMATTTPDARIAAIDQFLLDYPDSEFKVAMLQMATQMAQFMNDYDKLMVYGERTIEADPENYGAMLTMAGALAQRTREFDLDKEEKLTRAENFANKALEILETAPRPNPSVSDADWEAGKNDYRAEAHGALGFIAMAREDDQKAVAEFKLSSELSSAPNPNVELMLARELSAVNQHAEAVTVLDALLADPQTSAQVRQLAEQQRNYALQQQQQNQ